MYSSFPIVIVIELDLDDGQGNCGGTAFPINQANIRLLGINLILIIMWVKLRESCYFGKGEWWLRP